VSPPLGYLGQREAVLFVPPPGLILVGPAAAGMAVGREQQAPEGPPSGLEAPCCPRQLLVSFWATACQSVFTRCAQSNAFEAGGWLERRLARARCVGVSPVTRSSGSAISMAAC
jgi:hypothetical protein